MKSAKAAAILVLTISLTGRGAVKTGLDNIASYHEMFRGKRVGIITNHTGYNSAGRYITDVFAEMEGVKITALFGPEHGIKGAKAAGERINSETGEAEDIPVYSLYGKTLKPTPEMLKNVDVLVFDIQDVGARFYTYTYTMSLAMEAAAENGKRFVVLDRPNPINGLTVEGSVLEPRFASFVGLYPIPVRHGMTVGELALMFNRQGWLKGGVRADLVVVSVGGWRRGDWYDKTGLRFIKPSPNMTSLNTAIVYPGLCLLEGTNVSEGRGTDIPFRQFGAPWIDSNDLTRRLNELNLPGMRFEPATFTPRSSKFQGRECHGVRIVVTDRDRLESYFSGVKIIEVIHHMYPRNFEWKAAHFDRLCGTATIREAITSGRSADELRNQWRPTLESFLKIRGKYLIYRN